MKYRYPLQLSEQAICDRLEAYDTLASLTPILKHIGEVIDTLKMITTSPSNPEIQSLAKHILDELEQVK